VKCLTRNASRSFLRRLVNYLKGMNFVSNKKFCLTVPSAPWVGVGVGTEVDTVAGSAVSVRNIVAVGAGVESRVAAVTGDGVGLSVGVVTE
jgi:hypothetical protein